MGAEECRGSREGNPEPGRRPHQRPSPEQHQLRGRPQGQCVGGFGNNETNLFTAQPIINYNFPDFYLTSTPVVTADWERSSDDTWTVPVGGGIGKVWKSGGPPINTQLQAFYNVEKPQGSAEWQLRIQVQMLFPKKKKPQ